jgi:hypothetical protein
MENTEPRDVKLMLYGLGVKVESAMCQMYELPLTGEWISSEYFFKKFSLNQSNQKNLRVSRIVHHYVDDMSGVDYTEIHLEFGF